VNEMDGVKFAVRDVKNGQGIIEFMGNRSVNRVIIEISMSNRLVSSLNISDEKMECEKRSEIAIKMN
jgi:hypothetical protein